MKFIHPSAWWRIPAVVLPAAALAACSPTVFGGPLGFRFALMGLLPLSIIIAAHLYPRWWTPFVAAALAWTCFCFVLGLLADPRFWKWALSVWFNPISNLSAASAAAAVLISLLNRLGTSHTRRVGIDPPAGACRHCGYDSRRAKVCPECGKPNPDAIV